MATIRHLIEFVLNPFFISLLLLTLFLWQLWRRTDNRLLRGGFLTVLLILLICSTGWLAKTMTARLEGKYPAVLKVDPSIHWVVVLSGGQSEVAGIPPNSLLYSASIKRLVEGVRLYRQLPQAQLLLSGGGYGYDMPEATRLAELASWFNIPASRIILETGSINTADQAREIKMMVKEQPFYLVTSAIHMPRAMELFAAQGLHPVPAPTDYTFYWQDERWEKTYIPNSHNLFYLTIALHESLGRLWASLR